MKNSFIKNLIIIITIIILISILFYGIFYLINPYKQYTNEKKEIAKDLLNKKYNESFVIKSYSKTQLIDDYYKVIAYSESNPDIIFEASVNEDGKAVGDNYWAKCISKRVSDEISNNISSQGQNYVYSKLLIDDMYQTDTSMSLKEAQEKNILTDFTIYVFINNNFDNYKLYDDLVSSLGKMKEIYGTLKIYKTDSKTIEKVKKYLTTNSRADDGFNQIAASSFDTDIKFSNGLITEQKDSFANKIKY